MNDQLLISDVAELFNVTTKTLRHYEKLGLIAPERGENGYRVFSAENILRIQRIRNLQTLGLSLRRIKALLDRDHGDLQWDTVLQELLDETEAELDTLERRRERLEDLLDSELDELDPIIVARPPDDDRINAYLAAHLPETALAAWQRDKGIYAMLGQWQQHELTNEFMQVGYAGPASGMPAGRMNSAASQGNMLKHVQPMTI